VHRGVGKSPKRVRFVGQKVGGDQGIFPGRDDVTAERAVGAATFDPLHDCKMALYASGCLTECAWPALVGCAGSHRSPRYLPAQHEAACTGLLPRPGEHRGSSPSGPALATLLQICSGAKARRSQLPCLGMDFARTEQCRGTFLTLYAVTSRRVFLQTTGGTLLVLAGRQGLALEALDHKEAP
jgi:hypothetical protein